MRQIDYRKLAIGPEDVCDDIIDTALMIARESRKMNKGEDTVKMTELQKVGTDNPSPHERIQPDFRQG